MTLSLSRTRRQLKQHMLAVSGLCRLRRDSNGAPSPTKAVRKQPALSAAKPETVKTRAGDIVIDLVSGVVATMVKRKLSSASSPRKAVRNQPKFTAKLVK